MARLHVNHFMLSFIVLSLFISAAHGSPVKNNSSLSESNANINTTEHYNKINSSNLIEVSFETVSDDLVKVMWDMQNTDNSSIYYNVSFSGYVVSYTFHGKHDHDGLFENGNNFTESDMEFRSSQLSEKSRSLLLHLPLACEVRVCVTAVDGEQQGSRQPAETCSNLANRKKRKDGDSEEEEEGTDVKKLIAGIAAGCVFLIPCGVLLLIIWRKDKQMKESMYYEEVVEKEKLNPGFDMKDEVKTVAVVVATTSKGGGGGSLPDGVVREGGHRKGTGDGNSTESKGGSASGGPTIYVHSQDGLVEKEVVVSERL